MTLLKNKMKYRISAIGKIKSNDEDFITRKTGHTFVMDDGDEDDIFWDLSDPDSAPQ